MLLIVACVSSCDNASPVAPAPAAQPLPPPPAGLPRITPDGLWAFSQASSSFTTTDVYDAQEQMVRFTTAAELVWEDGTRHPGYRVSTTANTVDANKLCHDCAFDIRFGTRSGEPRAYLTVDYGHSNDGTVVDLEVEDGNLVLRESRVYPAGTFTLSGVVTAATASGFVPVEGASVSRSYGSGWQMATTDARGAYAISGLYNTNDVVHISKPGFQTYEARVQMNGDTMFDVVLVRF
jgi:hypothetical protein